jgi:hypothetical protein
LEERNMLEWNPKLVLLIVALVAFAATLGFALSPGGWNWGAF